MHRYGSQLDTTCHRRISALLRDKDGKICLEGVPNSRCFQCKWNSVRGNYVQQKIFLSSVLLCPAPLSPAECVWSSPLWNPNPCPRAQGQTVCSFGFLNPGINLAPATASLWGEQSTELTPSGLQLSFPSVTGRWVLMSSHKLPGFPVGWRGGFWSRNPCRKWMFRCFWKPC